MIHSRWRWLNRLTARRYEWASLHPGRGVWRCGDWRIFTRSLRYSHRLWIPNQLHRWGSARRRPFAWHWWVFISRERRKHNRLLVWLSSTTWWHTECLTHLFKLCRVAFYRLPVFFDAHVLCFRNRGISTKDMPHFFHKAVIG